jgi:hypothetical protein
MDFMPHIEDLADALEHEEPVKRALLTALALEAVPALRGIMMQGGTAGAAAAKLILEALGLLGARQKVVAQPAEPSA